jgi:gamma-glutamylcyclotransferase (GGCT)/AIG2-like uncharacterized protein YtfP
MFDPTAFFVYGTLQQKQLRGGMWPRQPLSVVPGVVRARLFDMGPYPAALKGDVWLLGENWQFQHVDLAQTKRVLDQIEGYQPGASDNEYVRDVLDAHYISAEDCEVVANIDSPVSCWMYFSPNQDLLIGKREIVPFCSLSEVISTVKRGWGNEKVAFWPDPKARVPRSFSEE